MKKIKRVIICFSIMIMALGMQALVHAESIANPLKNMPTKSSTIVGAAAGMGCDFFTPGYMSDFKMTATSSNKKVATVKVYNFRNGDKYSKGYEVIRKGYGTTKIKVTVKIGKKTYTKTCKYTYYKYSNPFSELKIGKNDYRKKMNKTTLQLPQSKLSGKISIKLKKGYKLERIWCSYGESYMQKQLKNKSKLPSNVRDIFITLKDTKTKARVSVRIETK